MLVKLRLQIPSFRQVGHDSASNEPATSAATPSKSFHVFVLEVASNCSDEFSSQSRVHRVEKRYSQFLGLHIELKKSYNGLVPEFPPKSLLNTGRKFLEQRRCQLQSYMQQVVQVITPAPQVLLNFLEIETPKFADTCRSYDIPEEEDNKTLTTHQPVMGFKGTQPFLNPGDCFANTRTIGKLPDTVADATLRFFYGSPPR